MKKYVTVVSAGIVIILAVTCVRSYLRNHRQAQNDQVSSGRGVEAQIGQQPQTSTSASNLAGGGQDVEALVARLRALKAQNQATRAALKQSLSGASNQPAAKQAEPQMPAAEFLAALAGAVAKRDPAEIRAVVEKVPNSTNCVAALQSLVADQNSSSEKV